MKNEKMDKFRKLKKGLVIYYFDEYGDFGNLTISKTTIKNFDKNYINFCECNNCNKRIGTNEEYQKYDNALKIEEVFFSREEIQEELIKKVHLILSQKIKSKIKEIKWNKKKQKV